MNQKKELCRNFQRGRCTYGDRCKFLHATQQQPTPNNPFGFGQSGSQVHNTNQQQQKPNPFGFGSQSNSSQPKGFSDFGSKQQNQPKPFENKWNRFSSVAPTNSTPSQKDNNQSQTANHKCTDSETCKRQIAEDFENERPLWKLTCYGHCKYLPCDISGDISYDELRAAAYDDAKRGLSLQSIVYNHEDGGCIPIIAITEYDSCESQGRDEDVQFLQLSKVPVKLHEVERERNLVNSKMLEFDNLLRNPYVSAAKSVGVAPSSFTGINLNAPPVNVQNVAPPFNVQNAAPPFNVQNAAPSFNVQNVAPPSVGSFSQLGVSLGSNTSNLAPTNNNTFGQPSPFQTPNQSFGGSGINSSAFGTQGSFGGQKPMQPFGSASSIPNFNSSFTSAGNNPSSISPATSIQFPTTARNQIPFFPSGSSAAANTVGQASVDNSQTTGVTGDMSIWLKQEWNPGEIPEEEPPVGYV